MKVAIYLANGVDEFENASGLTNSLPGALQVVVKQEERQSASGLIARVGGKSKYYMYPWHRVLRVEVEE